MGIYMRKLNIIICFTVIVLQEEHNKLLQSLICKPIICTFNDKTKEKRYFLGHQMIHN